MLIEQTLENLTAMQLHGMVSALRQWQAHPPAQPLPPAGLIGLLADAEWVSREKRKLTARLKAAQLKLPACVEGVDYRRSEERRGGEEWRSRGAPDHLKKKNKRQDAGVLVPELTHELAKVRRRSEAGRPSPGTSGGVNAQPGSGGRSTHTGALARRAHDAA